MRRRHHQLDPVRLPDPSIPGSGTAADPTPGCGDPAATDAVAYPSTTQETAALNFINDCRQHRARSPW